MNVLEVREARLRAQRLSGAKLEDVAEAVGWFGAVQAQDYPAASWALGERTVGTTAADVDAALAEGSILRTHVLRPTWHLVTREDLGWMEALSGPRVAASTRPRQLQLGIDEEVVARSNAALTDALRGGVSLARKDALQVLEDAGIAVDGEGQRLPWLLMRAELDSVICSGPLQGKQHTYALFAERVPEWEPLSRDEALAKLARSYFRARGPATERDFAWWSGFTLTDCRRAIALAGEDLQQVAIGETPAWTWRGAPPEVDPYADALQLLPNFDEYTVAYADRSAVLEPGAPSGDALANVIVRDGGIVGTWRRTIARKEWVLTPTFFPAASDDVTPLLEKEAMRYSAFFDAEVRLEYPASA